MSSSSPATNTDAANTCTVPIFPDQTPSYILSFQFSSWYPIFSDVSIKSTIIKPLSAQFREYLESESVFVPEGSEDVPAESTLSDDDKDESENGDEEEKGSPPPTYSFPELDTQIRACIQKYDAVFPKLNFTSPRDAAWVLPASSPLKCTSPADVYMLLKSSDFISHDLEPSSVFEGCRKYEHGPEGKDEGSWPHYDLELVLRKWYAVNPSRELRCFVRDGRLIGISQRDTNHYDFLNEPSTKDRILTAVKTFFETKVKPRIPNQLDYTFDFLLTKDLSRGHIIDFNPYSPRTDSLLFSYEDLRDIASSSPPDHIEFRTIDSASHPAAVRNAPTHQHNMMPLEAIHLSSGKSIEEFAEAWQDQLQKSMTDDS
ncbi:cytoplasmic protein [Coprinopsis cinerea okayama7|uniref:Cytoplasmic protein n=1 Tax=Coprinopsis cinerea (strain Okayama-7 / 130 / ATCC MYA-4618 / FGSC 9003) TaxID=240176 RepID=A8NQS1_COPC7|nr:cytoplasmic protein [Coprinopsis cinerea okayama7\|eukprot:XP_001835666.1 cytoplasmic protein [Coprinopsis cinerea okayama7\